jgi:hypothetical protein
VFNTQQGEDGARKNDAAVELVPSAGVQDGVHVRVIGLLALLGCACNGCPEKTAPPPPPLAGTADDGSNVRPVYAPPTGPIPALVSRTCRALHLVPKQRKAACCGESLGIEMTGACEQTLASAVADGAVRLEEAKVGACEAAIEERYQGCEWMGPSWQELPPACRGLIGGTKEPGAACRSSLECIGELRCHGAGPTDQGRCGPAAPVGSLCGTAVDALAVYTRQDDYERTHPSCAAGYCDRNRCQAAIPVGQACVSTPQCGPGARCADRVCAAGERGAAGEGCSGGDCQLGLRCVQSRCLAPKPKGEVCEVVAECQGSCLLDDGGASGVCGMSCDTAPVLKRLSPPIRPKEAS